MLVKALHTTLSAIPIDDYPVEVIADNPTLPVVVHNIHDISPDYDKEGITGYNQQVSFTILSKTVIECTEKSNQVLSAIIGMAGKTINTTEIETCFYVDESGPQEIADTPGFYNEIEFEIYTKNK